MPYTPIFNPNPVQTYRTDFQAAIDMPADKRDGDVYVYAGSVERNATVLAVNVAIATRRPLLVRGEAGSGKSSLASSIAKWFGRRYYEHVITSRTQAQDLLWQFDAVRRLGDAQVQARGRSRTNRQPFAQTAVGLASLRRARGAVVGARPRLGGASRLSARACEAGPAGARSGT
ncbi:MAG: AAA family ATPase [Rhodospirillales bacterium]|nr:AAA family ATPase [Rhodospirillales bacterium]